MNLGYDRDRVHRQTTGAWIKIREALWLKIAALKKSIVWVSSSSIVQ
jgi:hypothetical protein